MSEQTRLILMLAVFAVMFLTGLIGTVVTDNNRWVWWVYFVLYSAMLLLGGYVALIIITMANYG